MNSEQQQAELIVPRVSVVLAVFNGGPDLEKCLAAVASSSYPDLECIVVDDASTDGLVTPLAERYGFRVVTLEKQRGPAYARNVGAKEARGDILLFTDADVILHQDATAIALRTLDADPSLGAVFGSYDDKPGHPSFLSQYRNLLHHWVHQTGNEKASTFWTGCGAIRRNVFDQMGGFNHAYEKPSIEDIELGTRILKSGYGIRLEKSMQGKHLKQWQFWNMVKTDIFQRAVPWVKLLLNQRHAPTDLNLDRGSRLATIMGGLLGLAFLLLLLLGHITAILPALTFLLIAAATAWAVRAGQSGAISLLAVSLATVVPVWVYTFFPDRWAWIPLVLILVLVWSRLAFYRFLARKRSVAFALAVVPMQVVFFLGCALAVPIGIYEYFLKRTG
jgi:hypothetical protein